MSTLRRVWPLLLIAAVVFAVSASLLHRQLSWNAVVAHQAELRRLVATAPVAAGAAYVACYAAVVAVSVPLGVWITLIGGLLFGTAVGGTLAVAGATLGACLLFLAARGVLANAVAARAGPLIRRVRPGLERDGFSYLLAIRLVPIVPFWVTNLAPALVGMRFRPYAVATLLGIIPATFVFASVGAGLGSVLAAGARPDLSVIWSAPVLMPLFGLAALSLLPVAWRRWQARHG